MELRPQNTKIGLCSIISMFSRILPLQTLLLLICIPVQLLAVVLQVLSLVECKQCLLFARILEIERILEGGFVGWCYMLVAHGFLIILFCCVMLSRRPAWVISFGRLLEHIQTSLFLLH